MTAFLGAQRSDSLTSSSWPGTHPAHPHTHSSFSPWWSEFQEKDVLRLQDDNSGIMSLHPHQCFLSFGLCHFTGPHMMLWILRTSVLFVSVPSYSYSLSDPEAGPPWLYKDHSIHKIRHVAPVHVLVSHPRSTGRKWGDRGCRKRRHFSPARSSHCWLPLHRLWSGLYRGQSAGPRAGQMLHSILQVQPQGCRMDQFSVQGADWGLSGWDAPRPLHCLL